MWKRGWSPGGLTRARNRSLELVPEDADICVCTDLDEVFHPGWRAALEAAWTDGTTQAVYRYTWNFNADGSEGTVFCIEKIHARRGYRWTHPVHEVLERQEAGDRGGSAQRRGCSWTTTPTPPAKSVSRQFWPSMSAQ